MQNFLKKFSQKYLTNPPEIWYNKRGNKKKKKKNRIFTQLLATPPGVSRSSFLSNICSRPLAGRRYRSSSSPSSFRAHPKRLVRYRNSGILSFLIFGQKKIPNLRSIYRYRKNRGCPIYSFL